MSLLWIFLVIIIALSFVLYQTEKNKIAKIFKTLARQKNGRVKDVFGAYPQLTFEYEGIEILVTAMTGGSGGERTSQISASYFDDAVPEQCFFNIRSKSIQTTLEKIIGFKRIEINSSVFDDLFFIQGEDQQFIRALLTQELLAQVITLNDGKGLQARFQKVKFFDGISWEEKPRFGIAFYTVVTAYQDYVDLIDTLILFRKQIKKIM